LKSSFYFRGNPALHPFLREAEPMGSQRWRILELNHCSAHSGKLCPVGLVAQAISPITLTQRDHVRLRAAAVANKEIKP
jgi:hypothetical protein